MALERAYPRCDSQRYHAPIRLDPLHLHRVLSGLNGGDSPHESHVV